MWKKSFESKNKKNVKAKTFFRKYLIFYLHPRGFVCSVDRGGIHILHTPRGPRSILYLYRSQNRFGSLYERISVPEEKNLFLLILVLQNRKLPEHGAFLGSALELGRTLNRRSSRPEGSAFLWHAGTVNRFCERNRTDKEPLRVPNYSQPNFRVDRNFLQSLDFAYLTGEKTQRSLAFRVKDQKHSVRYHSAFKIRDQTDNLKRLLLQTIKSVTTIAIKMLFIGPFAASHLL